MLEQDVVVPEQRVMIVDDVELRERLYNELLSLKTKMSVNGYKSSEGDDTFEPPPILRDIPGDGESTEVIPEEEVERWEEEGGNLDPQDEEEEAYTGPLEFALNEDGSLWKDENGVGRARKPQNGER